MTHFEKIKEQIAAASVKELAKILVYHSGLFNCDKCEKVGWRLPYDCDFRCEKYCINWLNSEFKEGEK